MIRKIFFRLTLLLVFMLGSNLSFGSHFAGGSITYVCIGPNQYKVTLTIFRFCGGVTLGINPRTITAANNCGSPTINVVCNFKTGTGLPLPTECTNEPSNCSGGSAYGVEKYEFDGVFTVPTGTTPNCQQWNLSFSEAARNGTSTGLQANYVGQPNFYVDALINHNAVPCNRSAVSRVIQVPAYCKDEDLEICIVAFDPDNDSISYSLVDALQGPNQSVQYVNPRTGASPVWAAPIPAPFFDSTTGCYRFRPSQVQLSTIVWKMEEWRRSTSGQMVMVGWTKLDIQLRIDGGNFCDNLRPSYRSKTQTVPCNDSIFNIVLNTAVTCNTIGSDGSELRVFDSQGQGFPVLSSVPVNCIAAPFGDTTRTIRVTLGKALEANGIYYLYSKRGRDNDTFGNKCRKYMNEYDTLRLVVSSCYEFKDAVRVTNVTVDSLTNDAIITQWLRPANLQMKYFRSYEMSRGTSPQVNYFASVTDTNTLQYRDATPIQTPSQISQYYGVGVLLKNGYTNPISNILNAIWLRPDPIRTTNAAVFLVWNPYEGWSPNPTTKYTVQYRLPNQTVWRNGGSTTDTSINFILPQANTTYAIRVYTVNPQDANLKSYSNWIVNYSKMNLLNVSVDSTTEYKTLIEWKTDATIDPAEFAEYKIYSSKNLLTNPFVYLKSETSPMTSRTFDTPRPDVPDRSTWYYAVNFELNNGVENPISNNLNTIRVQGGDAASDTFININWNRYRGWQNPLYRIQYQRLDEDSTKAWTLARQTTSDSTLRFNKPYVLKETPMRLRIYTRNAATGLASYSNWINFISPNREVKIYNVITPNADNLNDKWLIKGIEFYPNAVVSIYNRWGIRVFHAEGGYTDANAWDGNSEPVGSYMYVIDFKQAELGVKKGNVELIR